MSTTTFKYSYTSSAVFDSLKRVKEKIGKNWSTEQYLNALDSAIENMLYPVLRSSSFLDSSVAGIAAWHADTSRSNHKITTYDRGEAIHYMLNFLTRVDLNEKSLALRRVRFDRGISLVLADLWLGRLKGFRKEMDRGNMETCAAMASTVSGSVEEIYSAIPEVQFWREQTLALRSQILQKYYRLVLGEAKHFYEEMCYSVSLDDTVQGLMLEAQRALDRCNPEKGTITSYMTRCVRFARSKLNSEMDTAYSTPGQARNGDYSNKAESLDEVDAQVMDESFNVFSDVEHVRKIARIVDPLGIGRYSLGIEEYVPDLRHP